MADYIGEPTRQTTPRSTDETNAITEIAHILRNMEKPPEVVAQITVPYTTQNRIRVRRFIIVNPTAFGALMGIAIGTKVYTFGIPGNDTHTFDIPFVIERGTDIGLVNDPIVYMVADLYQERNQ